MSKLNLGCGTDVRIGYDNIDLFPTSKEVKFGNFKALSYGENSVEEILAIDILKYIPINEMTKVFGDWHKFLQKDGRIYIESMDYNLFFNGAAYNFIDINHINTFLYSQDKSPICGIYNLENIENLLRQVGFNITSKFYTDLTFNITATK